MGKLVWEQDFAGGGGSAYAGRDCVGDRLSYWNVRIGNDLLDGDGNPICPGWGNGEEQFYTDKAGNLYWNEEGLNLCARLEAESAADGRRFAYTSARIDTRDKFFFRYGRLVVRARLPVGQGLWPAIWLMPQESAYGSWPASGEIDMMEARGRLPRQIGGTLHYGKDIENKVTDEHVYELPHGTIGEFRDYALEWEDGAIRWFVDEICYAESRWAPGETPFDRPFYLLLNLAVGGWYDRVPVDEAALPGVMTVASIRVYELAD
ncbi:glycoside hydrolase family 16 protein [Cohnella fermenti]|uniref:Glycoside hydrolase family 16 protein n=1 Tax=Cohnella fermenti TaxID=2565925 RepID=A0A4S4BQ36_9BACL|nr:glycoside hydrolase family 16 protein [Cohnella fermenti]THF76870.1 glycoside hydrolase family 16 protein [Cohnella fermenti]